MKNKVRAIYNRTKAALYSYKVQPLQTSPGTGNYAFLPAFALPLLSVGGPGTAYYKQYGGQPSQLYYGQEQIISGVEGVYAPGIQSQPLIDMRQHVANLESLAADNPGGGVAPIGKE